MDVCTETSSALAFESWDHGVKLSESGRDLDFFFEQREGTRGSEIGIKRAELYNTAYRRTPKKKKIIDTSFLFANKNPA